MIVKQDVSLQITLIKSLLYLLESMVQPSRKGNTGRSNYECAIAEIIKTNL